MPGEAVTDAMPDQPQTSDPDTLARAALDGLSAHIAILDGDGRILAVNAAWRAFAEANAGGGNELGGSVFAEGADYLGVCDGASGECEAGEAAAGIRSVVQGRTELFSLEYPCHAPHQRRWFNMRVTRFPGDGPARVVVSHEDVTGRKLAEESLRHRVEELAEATRTLERRNAELDQFAYITSHDLKAPLRGIANLSRWIEEDLGESLTPEVSGQLEMLRGRVNRMEAMIEGILEYSRVGRTPVAPETVDVKVLLTEVIDLLDPPPGMAVSLDAGLPVLRARRLLLQQVFQNLLSNALKHHDKAEGHVHVGVKDAGARFEFSVSDDGPGISPRYHEKIWAIFQTLEARDRVESTGVGLALVKKIVESQGGRAWVESEEGRGAAFRFTWPKQPKEEEDGQ